MFSRFRYMSHEGVKSYSKGCSLSQMGGKSRPSPEGAASDAELQIPIYGEVGKLGGWGGLEVGKLGGSEVGEVKRL